METNIPQKFSSSLIDMQFKRIPITAIPRKRTSPLVLLSAIPATLHQQFQRRQCRYQESPRNRKIAKISDVYSKGDD
ncbi:hypothetical protein TNCV_3598941 [Trichonephila clavipes]|nr:hypothetical protein TNCV_3598941 [Trichonephila clavipes]